MEPEDILRELRFATELVQAARALLDAFEPTPEAVRRYEDANFNYEALIGTEGTCLS